MDDFNKLLNAIGTLAEVSALYYDSLIRAGFSEDNAISLTSKVIGEILRSANDGNSKEDKHE